MNNSNEHDETKHLNTDEVAERWERVTKIFDAASALTGKQREDFLCEACGDDAEMRGEVEKLLKSFEDSESFMQQPAVAEAASMFEDKKTLIGQNTTGDIKNGSFVAGTVLASRYRIIGMLGKGGMGEVYKAEDIKLSQTVALKFLPDNFQKDSAALERFHAEVRNARQVSHVNVCRVFDIGEIDGKHFLSMEFIDGDDLSSLLRRVGRLSSERAIEIARQLCVGLSAIHNAGILHRDFKPANVIIDSQGKARITDFGIAGVEAEIAKDNLRVGTPAYMSPEQITGKDVSARSDIYALGLVLYEIFTGKQAFIADSIPELIKKQTSETPTNPSEFVKGIDPLVESVISQCIQKNPNDRPASALHVAMALPGGNPLQIALDAGQTPTPEMVAASPRKGILKVRTALILLASILLMLGVSLYFNSRYQNHTFAPIEKPPEVLKNDARKILSDLGYDTNTALTVSHFESSNNDYDRYVTMNGGSDLEKLRTGQPAAVYFWYRQSSRNVMPVGRNPVTEDDPPLSTPGTIYVKLDARGRLIKLVASPDKNTPQVNVDGKTDWNSVFQAAGLDPAKFTEAASEQVPPVFSDHRIAWSGTLADHPDIPIRIEAASFQGKPSYFSIVTPWDDTAAGRDSNTGFQFANILNTAIEILVFFGCFFLIYLNWKAGRSDLKGAFKVSFVALMSFILMVLLSPNNFFSNSEFYEIFEGVSLSGLQAAAVLFIRYAAIEPFIRRWWPELMISWNRLLAGEFRDPMIGRDIMIGGLIGMFWGLSSYVSGLIRDYVYAKHLTMLSSKNNDGLNGPLELASKFFGEIGFSNISRSFFTLTVLLILFLLLRRKVLARAGLALVWALIVIGPWFEVRGAIATTPVFICFIVSVLVLTRYGLVATIAANTFFYTLETAVTFDSSRFYFLNLGYVLFICLGLAFYSFYISIGDQKLVSGGLFKDLSD